jgi:hypothetical protein
MLSEFDRIRIARAAEQGVRNARRQQLRRLRRTVIMKTYKGDLNVLAGTAPTTQPASTPGYVSPNSVPAPQSAVNGSKPNVTSTKPAK